MPITLTEVEKVMIERHRAILLLISFIACHLFMRDFWGDTWSDTLLEWDGHTYVLHSLARWVFIYSPFIVFALYLFRNEHWTDVMGLKPDVGSRYLVAAVGCCMPMILGYAFLTKGINPSIADIVTGSVYPALFEEVIFRAILFGLLFRVCKWGFIPAALTSSLIFGFGHLYQSHDIGSALMLFAFMAVAGSWFAWLYCECGYRVWFPMWMHLIMNAAYGFFNMSGGAMGEASANIFKALTIVLSIAYVIWLIRQGKPQQVTKARLWSNQNKSAATPSSNLNVV